MTSAEAWSIAAKCKAGGWLILSFWWEDEAKRIEREEDENAKD
jgi:hypothetical protein